jgi:exodeoxyribonuclease V alpha subunit
VLTAVDVHVASTLGRLSAVDDDTVLLAAALAVRAPRLAHVCVDLDTVRATVVADAEDDDVPGGPGGGPGSVDALPWPEPTAWRGAGRRARSSWSAIRPTGRARRHRCGRRAAGVGGQRLLPRPLLALRAAGRPDAADRARRPVGAVDRAVLRAGLDRGFDGEAPDRQRVAAATAVLRHVAVIAGGPGTGKTTTVAAILQLLDEQAQALGQRPPAVALAAPTGKAAQRLTASLRDAAARLPGAGTEAADHRLRRRRRPPCTGCSGRGGGRHGSGTAGTTRSPTTSSSSTRPRWWTWPCSPSSSTPCATTPG